MQVLICAHRGAPSGQRPENTLVAFQQALADGAMAIELDVRRCKSGEIVVIHDKWVDRTTNGHGLVRRLTLAQLQRLDAGYGTHIPTLDEVLYSLQNTLPEGGNPTIFIELKAYGRPFLQATAEVLKTACARYGYEPGQLPVITFHWWQFRFLRKRWPLVHAGANISHLHLYADSLPQLAQRADLKLVNIPYQWLSQQLVSALHDRGILVSTWTVNKPSAVRRAAMWQVDCIMTDTIAGTRATLEKLITG
jgi:glycerophosphoryl diester phosphodiesterase